MDLLLYIRTEFAKRYERGSLPKDKLIFLQNLVPFGPVMQMQTYFKTRDYQQTKNGIYASVIMADLIVRSNWGTLLPAAEWSNLGMLRKNEIPKIKCTTGKWLGEPYRKYENWYDFSVDMTDHYIFSCKYDKVLSSANSDQQIDAMLEYYETCGQNIKIYGNIEEIIADYGLTEFDSFYR